MPFQEFVRKFSLLGDGLTVSEAGGSAGSRETARLNTQKLLDALDVDASAYRLGNTQVTLDVCTTTLQGNKGNFILPRVPTKHPECRDN